jgi:hypothetical protein
MPIAMKLCKKCGEEKEASKDNFGISDGYLCSPCLTCRNTQRIERRKASPEKYKKLERANQVRKLYGLSQEQLSKMEQKANFSCEICGLAFSEMSRKPNVDHCHDSGYVRGLLCNPCNFALGGFKDNIELMQKAINYLLKKKELPGDVNYKKYRHILDKIS